MNIKHLFLVGFLALGLQGCMTNQTYGNLIGGAAGGAIGSQFGGGKGKTAMTIAGTLAGAQVGGSIGRNMDETERLRREVAELRYQQQSFRQYNSSSSAPSYSTNVNGVRYNPNGMYHNNDAYYQERIYRAKGFVPRREAGYYYDDKPQSKYVTYKQQVCVKEPARAMIHGVMKDVVVIGCRQPNGKFAYLP